MILFLFPMHMIVFPFLIQYIYSARASTCVSVIQANVAFYIFAPLRTWLYNKLYNCTQLYLVAILWTRSSKQNHLNIPLSITIRWNSNRCFDIPVRGFNIFFFIFFRFLGDNESLFRYSSPLSASVSFIHSYRLCDFLLRPYPFDLPIFLSTIATSPLESPSIRS